MGIAPGVPEEESQSGRVKMMVRRAPEGYKKTLGREHTSTIDTVNNLGVLYRNGTTLHDAARPNSGQPLHYS